MRSTSLCRLLVLVAVFSLLSHGASALITVGALETPYDAYDAEVVGDVVYVSGGLGYPHFIGWLRVIDVSNPALPVEIGALDTPGPALDIEVVGDLAYVSGVLGYPHFIGWLRVIDVSDQANPVEIGSLDLADPATDVEVVGDLAYVTDWHAVLHVIDVSDPAVPTQLGTLDMPGDAHGLEVVGGLAYVVGETQLWVGLELIEINGWLRVIDVSSPAQPVQLGAISVPDAAATEVEVVGNTAYVVGDALLENLA